MVHDCFFFFKTVLRDCFESKVKHNKLHRFTPSNTSEDSLSRHNLTLTERPFPPFIQMKYDGAAKHITDFIKG